MAAQDFASDNLESYNNYQSFQSGRIPPPYPPIIQPQSFIGQQSKAGGGLISEPPPQNLAWIPNAPPGGFSQSPEHFKPRGFVPPATQTGSRGRGGFQDGGRGGFQSGGRGGFQSGGRGGFQSGGRGGFQGGPSKRIRSDARPPKNIRQMLKQQQSQQPQFQQPQQQLFQQPQQQQFQQPQQPQFQQPKQQLFQQPQQQQFQQPQQQQFQQPQQQQFQQPQQQQFQQPQQQQFQQPQQQQVQRPQQQQVQRPQQYRQQSKKSQQSQYARGFKRPGQNQNQNNNSQFSNSSRGRNQQQPARASAKMKRSLPSTSGAEFLAAASKISRVESSDTEMGPHRQGFVPPEDAPDNFKQLVECQWCSLCLAGVNSIVTAEVHYNGKSHQRLLRENGLPAGEYYSGVLNTGNSQTPELPAGLDTHYCKLCSVTFTNTVQMFQHYSGKKHRTNAQDKRLVKKTEQAETKIFHCKVCDVFTNTQESLDAHLGGMKHKSVLELQKKQQAHRWTAGGGAAAQTAEPSASTAQSSSSEWMFRCSLCSLVFSSQAETSAHMESSEHKGRLSSNQAVADFVSGAGSLVRSDSASVSSGKKF